MSVSVNSGRPSRWMEVGALLAILAVAAFLRFVQLDAVPPGMTHDEAAFGAEAEMVLSGVRPVYFALGYGHEPAYAYAVALAFSLFGRSLLAMRATSAVCGLLILLGTYLLARELFGVRVALVSVAGMAVAFWPLSMSRQALRPITLPLLWLPAMWCLWRGIQDPGAGAQVKQNAKHRRWLYFAMAGLLLGASFYTYFSSRIAWAVVPAFALYLLVQKRTRAILRRAWPGILIALGIAALVALPLALHLRAHPADEKRVGDMMEPIKEFLAGHPQRVLRHTWNGLRVFSWIGDRFPVYNIPGRPVFNWVGSVLFYAGLGLALWRWRDPRHAFLLIWLLVGLSPGLVTTNEGIFLRAIVAQPATYALVALALDGAWQVAQGKRVAGWLGSSRWGRGAWGVLAAALLLMEGARTYRAYFVDWPSRPETRNIYNHNLVASATYLRQASATVPEGASVGISALYPLYYHDPWIWRYTSGRDDLQMRWFDGRESGLPGGGGIVYPGEDEARYVFSALTPLDPALRSGFESHAVRVDRVVLDAADQNPSFEVWHWRGQDALAAELAALEARSPVWTSPETQFTQPDLRVALEGPVRFGDVMALTGYEIDGDTFRRGATVELVTYWRALRTVQAQDDWVTFLHLLDRKSEVIGGVDVLQCPPTGWRPGDVAVQVHRFTIQDMAPQGQEAYLELGVYRRGDSHRPASRLPVVVDGEAVGDRVLLAPIRVE